MIHRPTHLARVLPPLAVFVTVTILAEAAVRLLRIPAFELAPPSAVFGFMVRHWVDLLQSLWTTSQAALLGFFASALFGIIIAVLLSASTLLRRAFYPYTVFFQTVPIVAIAPLLVIWFDPGLVSVSISAFIVSVFPVIANTLSGLLSTDPALEDLFRLYGASTWTRFWKLKLPAATPAIVTGLRVAAGLAVIGTIVGEFLVGLLGAGEGLGVRIVSAKKTGHIDEMFAAVLIASLLGLAMFAAINLAGRLLLRNWHASERDS